MELPPCHANTIGVDVAALQSGLPCDVPCTRRRVGGDVRSGDDYRCAPPDKSATHGAHRTSAADDRWFHRWDSDAAKRPVPPVLVGRPESFRHHQYPGTALGVEYLGPRPGWGSTCRIPGAG